MTEWGLFSIVKWHPPLQFVCKKLKNRKKNKNKKNKNQKIK